MRSEIVGLTATSRQKVLVGWQELAFVVYVSPLSKCWEVGGRCFSLPLRICPLMDAELSWHWAPPGSVS